MERQPSSLTKMLSDARTKLDEAKTSQFFGSDSLIVREFSAPIDGKKWEQMQWIMTLTPTSPAGVLPIAAELKWDNPIPSKQFDINFAIKQLYAPEGVFSWNIGGASDGRYKTEVVLTWLGSGVVTIERV